MAKPGVPDLTTLRIEYAPPCRGAAATGEGYPFPILQQAPAPIAIGDGHGNPNKPPKPDNGKDKPYEGETPYIPPPQSPGGQGSTASDEGTGTGGTDPPPPPPDVVEDVAQATTTVILATPNPATVLSPFTVAATVQGPLGPWGVARFRTSGDALTRTAALPANAGPFTILQDVRFSSDTDLFQTIVGLVGSSLLFVAADASLALYVETANDNISFSGPGMTFSLDTWYTVAVVRGATAGSIDVYVTDMATPKKTGTGILGNPFDSMEWGKFGPSNLHRLDGYVRRLIIWSVALTPAELAIEAAAGEAVRRTNLEGEYLFQDGDGADTSGNDRDLTLSGSPVLTAGPTGTLEVFADALSLGTASVALGVASLPYAPGLALGSYTLVGEFTPNTGGYEGSESDPVLLTVNPPSSGRPGTGWLALNPKWLRRKNFGI